MKNVQKKDRVTSIIVTHEMKIVNEMVDKVIMLSDGKIIFEGTPKELNSSNDKYIKSRERIKKEAESLNLFDNCIVETDKTILNDTEFKETLENDYFKKVFESVKGGGYWIWKPYIIHKHLSKLNDGDILIYADSGCKIDKNNEIKKIFEDLNSNKYNMTYKATK